MQFPVRLRNYQRVFHIVPVACGIGLPKSGFARQPSVSLDSMGCVSWREPPHRVGERGEDRVSSLSSLQVFLRSPYLCTGAERWTWGDGQPQRPALVPRVSRHAAALRLRRATAGFHKRLRVSCVSSPFFPRSVGFGPTASSAKGAFTIVPSMLCHDHAIPSISSYSAKARRHILTNTPCRFHSKKYWCTELALPYSFGKAFHWQPVRRTYTIASNIRRGAMGLRPPPERLLYLRLFSRLRFGISGAARSHKASDTVHDLSVLMHRNIANPFYGINNYLRISS